MLWGHDREMSRFLISMSRVSVKAHPFAEWWCSTSAVHGRGGSTASILPAWSTCGRSSKMSCAIDMSTVTVVQFTSLIWACRKYMNQHVSKNMFLRSSFGLPGEWMTKWLLYDRPTWLMNSLTHDKLSHIHAHLFALFVDRFLVHASRHAHDVGNFKHHGAPRCDVRWCQQCVPPPREHIFAWAVRFHLPGVLGLSSAKVCVMDQAWICLCTSLLYSRNQSCKTCGTKPRF